MCQDERYNAIIERVENFERHIDDKSHEDIADFYQNQFDAMQGIASRLLEKNKVTPDA